jgi:DNA-binding NarL/FixJ family response regulator
MKSITIFHADDALFFTRGVSKIIIESGLTSVGETCFFTDLYIKFKRVNPDILLVEDELLDGFTIQEIKIIKRLKPNIKIIVLTLNFSSESMLKYIGKVDAYISKWITPIKFIEVVKSVYSGEQYFSMPARETSKK